MSPIPRRLQPAEIAVTPTAIWIGDDLLPVIAEVDPLSGKVRRVVTWPVGEDSSLEAVGGMVIAGESLWVLSPRAGGVVVVNTHTGEAQVIEVSERVDRIWPAGTGCVVCEPAVYPGDWRAPSPPQRLWKVERGAIRAIVLEAAVVDLDWLGDDLLAIVKRATDAPVAHPVADGVTEVLHPGQPSWATSSWS